MKQEVHRFELSINSTISEVYGHFIKANSDQSLDRMFEGLQKKTQENYLLSEREGVYSH